MMKSTCSARRGDRSNGLHCMGGWRMQVHCRRFGRGSGHVRAPGSRRNGRRLARGTWSSRRPHCVAARAMVRNAVEHGECAGGDVRLRGGRGVGVRGGRRRGSIRRKRELRGGRRQYGEGGGGGTERAAAAGHRRGADGEGGRHVWRPGAAVRRAARRDKLQTSGWG